MNIYFDGLNNNEASIWYSYFIMVHCTNGMSNGTMNTYFNYLYNSQACNLPYNTSLLNFYCLSILYNCSKVIHCTHSKSNGNRNKDLDQNKYFNRFYSNICMLYNWCNCFKIIQCIHNKLDDTENKYSVQLLDNIMLNILCINFFEVRYILSKLDYTISTYLEYLDISQLNILCINFIEALYIYSNLGDTQSIN